mgnify:CR=1 FL=1
MSYSSIARFYKLIESVTIGRPLLDARLAHLQRLAEGPAIQHALLVGEGNGSFLLPFAQQFPNTLITVLDESPAMLRVAQNRLDAAGIDTAPPLSLSMSLAPLARPLGLLLQRQAQLVELLFIAAANFGGERGGFG